VLGNQFGGQLKVEIAEREGAGRAGEGRRRHGAWAGQALCK
jgi:hypothetical protein